MRRLIDGDGSRDPRLAMLARLLREVEPAEPTADSRARVRLRLGGRRTRPVRRWHSLAVALLIAGNAATAAALNGPIVRALRQAAVATRELVAAHAPWRGSGRRGQNESRSGPGFSSVTPPESASAMLAAAGPAAADAVALTIALPPPPVEPVEPRAAETATAGNHHATSRARHGGRRARPAAMQQPPRIQLEETAAPEGAADALVIAGIRALKRDDDPERAQILFEDYLRLNPDGALAEEAMVRSVEAALALGDGVGVRARAYHARFPTGVFRSHVEALLAPPPPSK